MSDGQRDKTARRMRVTSEVEGAESRAEEPF